MSTVTAGVGPTQLELVTESALVLVLFQSRDRKMVGDLVGAQRHGSTAFSLNVANTALAAVLLLLVIGLCFHNPMMLGALSGLWLRLI